MSKTRKRTISVELNFNESDEISINMQADQDIPVCDMLRVFDSLSEKHTSILEKHVKKNPQLTKMEQVEKLTLKDIK